jgi:Ca2+-binding EF-hand superfamily protein
MSDLGFPMGSQAVSDILVYCHLDTETGYLDFSGVSSELQRERKDVQSRVLLEPSPLPSSSAAVEKPWREGAFLKDEMLNGKQQQKIKLFRENVHEIYRKFAHNQYNYDQVLAELAKCDIAPTKMFLCALHKNRSSGELSFEEFIRFLTNAESSISREERLMHSGRHRAAGAPNDFDRWANKSIKETDRGFFLSKKRSDPIKDWDNRHRKEGEERPIKGTGCKLIMEIDEDGLQTQKLMDSRAVKKAVYYEKATPSLLSQSQLSMQVGYHGGDSSDLTYNSEQKLLRAQILALLRKLDAGKMSLNVFQEKVYDLNLELPDKMIMELSRFQKIGFLDLRKCVSILDADLFKMRALGDRYSVVDIEEAKGALKSALIARGYTSICDLASVYRNLQGSRSRSGKLSFNEFRQGLEQYGIGDRQLRLDHVRVLFHIYDRTGDGLLDIHEFIKGICGHINARRLGLIRLAFSSLDRYNEGKLSLELLSDKYYPVNHPDVLRGRMSEREAMKDLMHVFTAQQEEDDGKVADDIFEDYFVQLSTFVDSDDDFERFIRTAFSLDARAPPPSLRLNRGKGINGVEVPRSMQVHGDLITWNQEASKMENESQGPARSTKRSIYHDFKKTNLGLFVGPKEKVAEDVAEIDDCLVGGLTRRNVFRKPTRGMLYWPTQYANCVSPDSRPLCMRDYASQRVVQDSAHVEERRMKASFASRTNRTRTPDPATDTFEFRCPSSKLSLDANIFTPAMKTTAAELPFYDSKDHYGFQAPFGSDSDVPAIVALHKKEDERATTGRHCKAAPKASKSLAEMLAIKNKSYK